MLAILSRESGRGLRGVGGSVARAHAREWPSRVFRPGLLAGARGQRRLVLEAHEAFALTCLRQVATSIRTASSTAI
eukprot:3803948-Pleurochrysis_carterae.AAC.1